MRLSPALLGALLVAVTIYAATFVVAADQPAKLLGGFGVLGLFVAALLAEPDLLHAPDELMRQACVERRPVSARAGLFALLTVGMGLAGLAGFARS